MKKTTLILTLMVFTCISALRAQTYISGYSSHIDDDGEWTEWIEENVEITIDSKERTITLFDPLWLTIVEYEIIRVEEGVLDEDNDFVTVYQCKDNSDGKWKVTVIDLVTTDPGKQQINFSNDTESTSYHVMRTEEE